jgi:hypothetical protein
MYYLGFLTLLDCPQPLFSALLTGIESRGPRESHMHQTEKHESCSTWTM